MKALVRKLVQSNHLDLLGVALILGVCLYKGFHETIYFQGKIQFGIPISELSDMIKQGAFPLGILSCVGAMFSMISTRLIGKQSNLGNWIGVLITINSGAIDYMFGNGSAIITYPLTFIIMVFSVNKWRSQNSKIRDRDHLYYLILLAGFALGFILVYLGAYLFGGNTQHSFLIIVSIVFGLSIGGNICSALKYEETWFSWVIYNVVNLIKNTIQLNIANIVKYIFYLFNAGVTLLDWKYNRGCRTHLRLFIKTIM